MGLAYVGPVKTDFHGDPAFRWVSAPTPGETRDVEIDGRFDWAVAEQLSELVTNTDASITVAGRKGVLAPLWAGDKYLSQFVGWYVLESFELDGGQETSVSGFADGKLTGCYLGQSPEVVLARQSVPMGNDYGLAARSLAVSPFRPASVAGDHFVVEPGGSFFTRAYDPNAYDPAVPTPAESAAIGIYTGTVTDTGDDLATIAFPRVAWSKSVPKWLTQQNGNVWAYDRRAGRDVFGPHPFLESTDILIDNGLLRIWGGNRGLRPFLNCRIFDGATWREPGTVQFGSSTDELVDVRLVGTTAEATTIALSLAGKGDVLVTLKRGEQILRCFQPPRMSLPTWSGIPPASRAVSARISSAHFTKGLAAGADVEDTTWAAPFATWAGDDEHSWDGSPYQPDIRLRWPADVSPSSWNRVYRYQPLQALSSLGTVGLLTIYSAGGIAEVELYVDTDAKAKVRVRDTEVLVSGVLSFAAGDDVVIGLGYDGTTLTLSWRTAGGTITQTPAAVAIAAAAFYDEAFFVNFSRWGDGAWGDGVWGGVTHYPSGVIDNDMVFEDKLSLAEFTALASAPTPLANLPVSEGRLRRYAPFDAQPIVSLPAPASGRSVDPVTDDNGFIKVTAALNAEFTDVAAYLATTAPNDTPADQHAQAAAQNDQRVRVRQ